MGDIDGDGWLDMAVTTREGWIFVWGTQGRADQELEWASIHHDAQNTGNYQSPLPVQAGPADTEGDDRECGCRGDKEQAWLLLPLSVYWDGVVER